MVGCHDRRILPSPAKRVRYGNVDSRVRSEGVALAWLPAACALVSILLGVLAVLGWLVGAPALYSPLITQGSMKFNSAVCCVLAGLSLLLQIDARGSRRARAVGRTAAALVVAIALATLLEDAIGMSLIDELVVHDHVEHVGMPGRMSPFTSFGLVCVGTALAWLDEPHFVRVATTLPVLAAFVGLLALIGYVLGAEALYGIGDFTRVSPQTALVLVVLSLGQLAARPDRGFFPTLGSDSIAGFMSRRLLPAAVIVPTVVGLVLLQVHRGGYSSAESTVATHVLVTIVMSFAVIAWNARSLMNVEDERARIDHELRASEAKFRAVAEGAREAIVSADAFGRIAYMNPGANRMFGYAADEALGRPLSLLMPTQFRDTQSGRPGSHGVVHTNERQVMGKITESTGVRKSGEPFPLEISLTTWGGDQAPRFTAIIRDVSERKRAERERHMLASIVECSGDAIYSTALDGTITSWNRAAERIFGYSAAEIVGRDAALLLPQTRTREGSGIHERVAHGQRVDLPETTRMTKDGRVIPVWLTVSPVEDASHTVVGASAIVRDLTERNQATQERDRFFSVTQDLLCVIDGNSILRRVNPAFLRTLGYAEADVIGKTFGAFVHPDDLLDVSQALVGPRQGAPISGFTCRFRCQDRGGYRWLAWVCAAEPDGRLYAAARDVTEERAAEQRLRDALAEKEVLLKEIHHRVKNNLQIISSLLNFQSRYVTDPSALAAFRESQDRVRSMALFHEKLYQAKDLAHVELAEYLKQMAQMLRHTYALGGSEIALNVRAEGVDIGVDTAVPCGLIANELITNSLKYAFPGGRRGSIDVELKRREGGGFTFVVADDGVGIPPEVDIQKSPSLGLRLVVALVEQLDGAIRVERGGGTRFEVTVPGGAS
jgi:PAS domain S-box-containing protein